MSNEFRGSGLLLTTNDLKAMAIPLVIALIRTLWRLSDDAIVELAKKVRKTAPKPPPSDPDNVGSE